MTNTRPSWAEPIRRKATEVAYHTFGWPRRIVALLCLVLAGWSAIHDRRQSNVATTGVVIAARNLSAGARLSGTDVRLVRWPTPIVPRSALDAAALAIGAVIAGAVNSGEPITTARLRGRGLTTGLPAGWTAVTVAVDNPAAVGLVRPGDHVDVLATTPVEADVTGTWRPARAHLLAEDVTVLDVLAPTDDAATTQQASVVLAADRTTTLNLAAQSATPLTITLRSS